MAASAKVSAKRWRALGFAAVGGIFVAVLWLLRRELRHVNYHDIMRNVRETPVRYLLTALALTTASYLTLTIYDFMGLRYAEKPLPYRKTAFASFIAYVFSHNIGLSLFGGLAFRYRIYSSWELTATDVARVSLFCGATFWLGLFMLGGSVFTVAPPPSLAILPLAPWAYRVIGGFFLLLMAAYVVLCHRGGTLRVRRFEIKLPSGRLALAQIGTATLDWVFASLTLYVLLPDSVPADYVAFLSVYVLAAVAGIIAHVPAGLGVIETVVLLAFAPYARADAILGALLVYRGIYYLAPLGVAVVWMGAYEAARATGVVKDATSAARRWFDAIIPRIFSVLVFASGVVLLFSGAMPAIEKRREWLEHALPLVFVEASHLLGSITGAALLLVARGLQKRLDGAFVITCALLGAGIAFSLIKGVDYEEAIILSVALALLLPCRAYFYRKASLLDARFSPGWIVAIVLTLLSTLWLGAFANKHVEYTGDLWWTFTFAGDVPRSLRATVGAVASTLLVGIVYLLRPGRGPEPTAQVSDEVLRVVRAAGRTYPSLVLLHDKAILMNEARNAFVMYATEGRSWVAMGDPVGPESERQELVWRFRDLADRYGGWPVFYQADVDCLRLYVDAGFSLLKIGEEAIVKLPEFNLDGRHFKHLRNVMNRFAKDGWGLEVLPAGAAAALLPDLERVSDAWLAAKGAREKRFSLGFFEPAYLERCPLAVVRRQGVLSAFANLWDTEAKTELSVDLMRYDSAAPKDIMDYLMLSLIQWGQAQGYATFNLGMAPFSGMESRPLAPLWSRLGAKLFEHGERFYNFQGLREYKEKFHPDWRPKYLASPAGRALPVILANVATLISGGIKGAMPR